MASLMSHILSGARMKSLPLDTPLDLAWTLHTRTTCDSLIAQEPLRTEHDISEDEQQQDRTAEWGEAQGVDTCSAYNSDSEEQSNKNTVKPEPHQFSIAALIGDIGCDKDCGDSSAPAQVFSHALNQSLGQQQYILNASRDHNRDHSIPWNGCVNSVSGSQNRNVYWCHVCNAICEDESDAYRHRFTHSIRRDACNLRREILNRYGHVTCHKMADSERITCGLCDKVVLVCFFHKHLRLHDGHFCTICGQDFPNNSRLEDHINIHTGNTPFSCQICDRKFAKRSSLTQHQRYHRNHKGFTCRFCRKCFNSKYACAVHERLHTGDNPFKCLFPGCTRAFPQKIQLKLHINSRHRN